MSLTKQDIKIIKTTISDEIESLAIITSKTFDSMEKGFREEHEYNQKQFENIDKRFDANDSAHRSMNARLDLIETDLSHLRSLHAEVREIRRMLENAVTRHEFKVFEKRLVRVEKHLNLSPLR